jgi:predicted metalloprotease with PDZ domain
LALFTLFLLANLGASVSAQAVKQKRPRPTTTNTVTTQSIAPPEISYTIGMPRPFTNLLDVEVRIRGERLADQTDLIMPVWTPGSYLVREFERNVQDFKASDLSGAALAWEKTNKNTWRIVTKGVRELTVFYRVYCKELSVRTSEVTDQHAFWNNATALMYPEGMLRSPSTVRVVPYQDWQIYTGLPAVEGQANTYRAPNYDILYDSPFIVGKCTVVNFSVRGIPHRIVIDGAGNYDPEKLRAGVQKIVETAATMMGGLPYQDYTFFLIMRSTGGGGLEHLNSNVIISTRFRFNTDAGYTSLFGTIAHEFFHAWNVKRIRPDALGPFDYTGENYTKLLWVAEGLTEYYADQLLLRAKFYSEGEYLGRLAGSIRELQNVPGRFQTSLEETSLDAWIKYYRPDANSINRQVSYYDKGAIVGAMLDLEIRRASHGARSLDDVMRYLYTEFALKERNYTPADFQRAAELAAGTGLEQFFAHYVRGRDEIAYNAFFDAAGLRLETVDPKKAAQPETYLGAEVGQEGDRLVIRQVLAGTPAFDQGLNTGDQVLAVDGVRVSQINFFGRLAEHKPGDTVTLTIFRDDDLRTLQVVLGGRVPEAYRIVPLDQPSIEQKAIYRAWIGK